MKCLHLGSVNSHWFTNRSIWKTVCCASQCEKFLLTPEGISVVADVFSLMWLNIEVGKRGSGDAVKHKLNWFAIFLVHPWQNRCRFMILHLPSTPNTYPHYRGGRLTAGLQTIFLQFWWSWPLTWNVKGSFGRNKENRSILWWLFPRIFFLKETGKMVSKSPPP